MLKPSELRGELAGTATPASFFMLSIKLLTTQARTLAWGSFCDHRRGFQSKIVMDNQSKTAAFVAMDSAGQQLAYIYFEEEPGRRSAAARRVRTSRATAVPPQRT